MLVQIWMHEGYNYQKQYYPLNISYKSSVIDVWQRPKYALENYKNDKPMA